MSMSQGQNTLAGGPPMGGGPGGPQQMGQHPGMGSQQGPLAGGPPPNMPPGHGQQPMTAAQGHQGQASGSQGQQQEQPKMDNISRAKTLVPQLKDSLGDVLKLAAVTINGNYQIDGGSKSVEIDPGRFDRTYEKFFAICDQMELQLKTSIECVSQEMNSKRYLPTPVTPAKMEGSLTYPQYISIVQGQIAYAKEVHDTLVDAAQKLSTDL